MSKKVEIVTLEIDSETLAYKADFRFAYIGDLYIVLLNLIERLESGQLASEMELCDESGSRFSAADLREHIAYIREQLGPDESELSTISIGGKNN